MNIKKANQALSQGIRSLFHYQALRTENDKIWLKETLLENKIYCSNPVDFNDPWDMKPLIKELDSEQIKIEFISYLYNAMIEMKLPESTIKKSLSSQQWIDYMIENSALSKWESFEKLFRVYCLTPKPDNLLMWSHYADKHRGICLEFDTNNTIFGSAWEVEYHEEFPYHSWKKDFDIVRLALTKSKCWSYEDEYRLTPKTEYGDSIQPQMLKVDSNNKLLLPSYALKSIIIGCMADYNKIQDFIHSIRPDLPIKRSIMQRNRYGIFID